MNELPLIAAARICLMPSITIFLLWLIGALIVVCAAIVVYVLLDYSPFVAFFKSWIAQGERRQSQIALMRSTEITASLVDLAKAKMELLSGIAGYHQSVLQAERSIRPELNIFKKYQDDPQQVDECDFAALVDRLTSALDEIERSLIEQRTDLTQLACELKKKIERHRTLDPHDRHESIARAENTFVSLPETQAADCGCPSHS